VLHGLVSRPGGAGRNPQNLAHVLCGDGDGDGFPNPAARPGDQADEGLVDQRGRLERVCQALATQVGGGRRRNSRSTDSVTWAGGLITLTPILQQHSQRNSRRSTIAPRLEV
jgi:hypothetical protein